MPQHKSMAKRVKTNERDRKKNTAVRSQVRSATRKVREGAKGQRADDLLREAQSVLDNAVRKGVLHQKTSDRQKRRLARLVQKGRPGKGSS